MIIINPCKLDTYKDLLFLTDVFTDVSIRLLLDRVKYRLDGEGLREGIRRGVDIYALRRLENYLENRN